MASLSALHQFLDHSARVCPDHTAVEESGHGAIAYRDLAALSDRLRDRLCHLGVGPGDRVGIYMRKSIDAVIAIFGVLKAGAAYVPVDPNAPAARNAYILNNCAVKVAVVEDRFTERLRAEIGQIGEVPILLSLAGTGGGLALSVHGQPGHSGAGAARHRALGGGAPV